ncbi:MAG TPA: YafY family protein [Ktedonobacterales bacterium]
MKELDRILGILLALQGRRKTSARQLAARFNVSSRTIYRDLQTMSLLGIPVYAERGRNGGVRLLEGYFLPPLMFSRSEAIALLLGVILLRSLRSVPFEADVDTATQKLLAAIPEPLRTTLARLEKIIGVEMISSDVFHPEPDASVVADQSQRIGAVVTTFIHALLDGDAVRISYQSPYRDSETPLAAAPRGLFWDRGRWYLVVNDSEAEEALRFWRADRVMSIRLSGGADDTSAPFDVSDLLGHAWLESAMRMWRERAPVRLRITSEQERRLRQDWYYQFARYERQPDGAVEMTLGERDPELVLALVRWLGPGAELLSPAPWRAMLRAELEAMLQLCGEQAV